MEEAIETGVVHRVHKGILSWRDLQTYHYQFEVYSKYLVSCLYIKPRTTIWGFQVPVFGPAEGMVGLRILRG